MGSKDVVLGVADAVLSVQLVQSVGLVLDIVLLLVNVVVKRGGLISPKKSMNVFRVIMIIGIYGMLMIGLNWLLSGDYVWIAVRVRLI